MANKRAAEQETDSEICHRLMRAIQIGLRNNDSVHIENMLAKFEDDLEWRCSLAGVADHVGDEMVLNVNEEIRKCLLTEKAMHRWERIYAPVAQHESSDSEHYEVEGGPTDYNSDFSDEDSPEDHMYQPVEINSSDDDDSEDEGDSDTQEESESASDEAQEESGSGSEDEEPLCTLVIDVCVLHSGNRSKHADRTCSFQGLNSVITHQIHDSSSTNQLRPVLDSSHQGY